MGSPTRHRTDAELGLTVRCAGYDASAPGTYRLARLAAKYSSETLLDDLLIGSLPIMHGGTERAGADAETLSRAREKWGSRTSRPPRGIYSAKPMCSSPRCRKCGYHVATLAKIRRR